LLNYPVLYYKVKKDNIIKITIILLKIPIRVDNYQKSSIIKTRELAMANILQLEEVRMNLSKGSIGQIYVVEDIRLESSIMRRLQMLGLTQGTTVELLNKKRNGALIFKVRGTRFAIGKNVAEGILIGGGIDEQ